MRSIKNIRIRDYNYSSNGYYFVTICTRHRRQHLIDVVKDQLKQIIDQVARDVNGVKVDHYEIVPTHIHLIIILDGSSLSLGEVIRRIKAKSSKVAGSRLWQPNYYEHVIRGEQALTNIREYIQRHPVIEKLKLEEMYQGSPDESGSYEVYQM